MSVFDSAVLLLCITFLQKTYSTVSGPASWQQIIASTKSQGHYYVARQRQLNMDTFAYHQQVGIPAHQTYHGLVLHPGQCIIDYIDSNQILSGLPGWGWPIQKYRKWSANASLASESFFLFHSIHSHQFTLPNFACVPDPYLALHLGQCRCDLWDWISQNSTSLTGLSIIKLDTQRKIEWVVARCGTLWRCWNKTWYIAA